MKAEVIGAGIVGSSLIKVFRDTVDYLIIDPAHEDTIPTIAVGDSEPDFIFMCLPTPSVPDGSIDVKHFHYYLDILAYNKFKGIVVIKSTLVPYYLERFVTQYAAELRIVYNPEFLREKHAQRDTIQPDMHILGGESIDTKEVQTFFIQQTTIKRCPIQCTDIVTASLAKYFINSYLATKVIFMNEFFELFEKVNPDGNWEKFRQIVTADHRISSSHTQVPGHDGELGFGGMCFPKDTEALLNYARLSGVELEVLRSAVDKNGDIREIPDK